MDWAHKFPVGKRVMIEAVLFTISLTFTIHEQPQFVNANINANITLNIPTEPVACGTAWLPHITTIDASCFDYYGRESLIRHEWAHHDQWAALGPAFLPSYWLTNGRAFEPYGDMNWVPPEGMQRNCPLVRVSDRVEFMPCYRL